MPENLLYILTFVGFGGLATIGGWVWRLATSMQNIQNTATTAKAEADKAAEDLRATQKMLTEFQIDANRRFVGSEAIAEMEKRLGEQFSRLADRLDRLFENKTANGPGSR